MKLVDILARELRVWPDDCEAIEQDRRGSCLYKVNGPAIATYVEVKASDADTAKVTKLQWQAAVDALKDEKVVEWNGEGLPPVGAVCEWAGCTFAPEDPKEPDLRIGDQVTIIAHFKDGEFDLAAFTFNPQIHNPSRGTAWVNQGAHGCFRPIRTPEQIASEKREADILEILHATGLRKRDGGMEVAAAIYRAGYRKFEIVDN